MPAETQNQVKSQLLTLIEREEGNSMRKKLCDIVVELAHNLMDDEGNNMWPEFLQFLFECANSPNVARKEIALTLFRLELNFL